MITWFKNLVKDLTDSMKMGSDGFSIRKICAVIAVCAGVKVTLMFCDAKVLNDVLTTWLMFAGICLGLITVSAAMDKFKGFTTSTKETKVETKETTEVKNDNG